MILNFRKLVLQGFVLSLFFCFAADANAQKSQPSIADKREIIRVLLEEIVKNKGFANKTIYVSKQNLPTAIKNNFPRVKNVSVKLVAESSDEICPYEFSEFSRAGRTVLFSFGDCNEALGYSFEKVRGKWKNVPLEIRTR